MVSGALFLLIPVVLIIVLCSAYFLRVYLARHRAQLERNARHTEQNTQGEEVVEDDFIRMSNLHSPTAARSHRLHHTSRRHGEVVYYMNNPVAEGIPGFVLAGNTSETMDQSVTAQYPEAVPVFGNREEAHAYRQRLREYQREQREERRNARREHRRRQRELQRMGHSSTTRSSGIRLGSSTSPPYSGAATPQGVSRSQSRTDHPMRVSGELPLPEYRPDEELDEEEEEDDGYRSCTSSSSSSTNSEVASISQTTDYVSTTDHSRSVSQAGVSGEIESSLMPLAGDSAPNIVTVPSSSTTAPVNRSIASLPTGSKPPKRSKRFNYGRGWYIKPVSSTSNSGLRGPNDDGIVMGSMTNPLSPPPEALLMDRSLGRLVDLSLGVKSISSREVGATALDLGLLGSNDNATNFYASPLELNPSSPGFTKQDTMHPDQVKGSGETSSASPPSQPLTDAETGRPVSNVQSFSPRDFFSPPNGPGTTAPVTPRSEMFRTPTSPNHLQPFPTSTTVAGVTEDLNSPEHSQTMGTAGDHNMHGMSLPQYPVTPETAVANPDVGTTSEMSGTTTKSGGGWSSFFQTLSIQARQERKEQRRRRKEEAKRLREEEERRRLAYGNDAPPAVLMGWKESGPPLSIPVEGGDTLKESENNDPLSDMGSSTATSVSVGSPGADTVAQPEDDLKPLPSRAPTQYYLMREKESERSRDGPGSPAPSSAGAPPSIAQTARQVNDNNSPGSPITLHKESTHHADDLCHETELEEPEVLEGNNVYRLYGVSDPHRSPRPTMSASRTADGIGEAHLYDEESCGLQLPHISTTHESSTGQLDAVPSSSLPATSTTAAAPNMRQQIVNHQRPNIAKHASNNSMSHGPSNGASYSSMTNVHHRPPISSSPREDTPNTTESTHTVPPQQVSLGKRVMVVRHNGDAASASPRQNPLVSATPIQSSRVGDVIPTKIGKSVSRESSFSQENVPPDKSSRAHSYSSRTTHPNEKPSPSPTNKLRRPTISSSSGGIPIPIFSPNSSLSSAEDELDKPPVGFFGDPSSNGGDGSSSPSPVLYSLAPA